MLILAVDDDQDDLGLFKEALMQVDPSIKVITASNGEEALNFLQKIAISLPDFVFLDINMPRIDGRECLRSIRKDKLTRHLPVYMYSTTLSPADKQLFLELDAQFLTKSPSYNDLVASLRKIIKELEQKTSEPVSLVKPKPR